MKWKINTESQKKNVKMSGTVGQLFSKLSAVVASPASSGLQNHHKMVIDRKTIEKTWKYMDKVRKSTFFTYILVLYIGLNLSKCQNMSSVLNFYIPKSCFRILISIQNLIQNPNPSFRIVNHYIRAENENLDSENRIRILNTISEF